MTAPMTVHMVSPLTGSRTGSRLSQPRGLYATNLRSRHHDGFSGRHQSCWMACSWDKCMCSCTLQVAHGQRAHQQHSCAEGMHSKVAHRKPRPSPLASTVASHTLMFSKAHCRSPKLTPSGDSTPVCRCLRCLCSQVAAVTISIGDFIQYDRLLF